MRSTAHMLQGFKRIGDDIADITLDIPKAAEYLAALTDQAKHAGVTQ